MKDALLRAFLIGCEIKLEYGMGKCYINVWHPATMNGRDQYCNLDETFDLPEKIDYCVRELLKNIDQKEIQNNAQIQR